ncbi:hypothetical protein ACNQFN_00510 [Thauera butanivorans]|uniref:hypothetical protein n=1 Tax=Thauera butanivorans TaxID=86174 RepID=UPI003AB1D10A
MTAALRPVLPTLWLSCPATAGTVFVPPGEAAFADSAPVAPEARSTGIQHPFQATH